MPLLNNFDAAGAQKRKIANLFDLFDILFFGAQCRVDGRVSGTCWAVVNYHPRLFANPLHLYQESEYIRIEVHGLSVF